MSLRDFVNGRAPQTIRGIAIVKRIRCILFEFIDPRNSLHEHIHVLVGKLNSYFLGSVARGEASRLPLFIGNCLSILDGTNPIIILIVHCVRERDKIKESIILSKEDI